MNGVQRNSWKFLEGRAHIVCPGVPSAKIWWIFKNNEFIWLIKTK